uniref:Secreted protein n=1 Tax=Fagus sylvatica TaxID=28930 RepID=A0A2N9FNM5_FAGSY
MLCSALLSFLFLCLCSPSLPLLSAQLCRATPSRPFLAQPPPPRAGPDALCLYSFSAPSLYRPRSRPDEAVGELLVEGGAVGLELGSELVVKGGAVGLELGLELLVDGGARGLLGLWVCDGGFV